MTHATAARVSRLPATIVAAIAFLAVFLAGCAPIIVIGPAPPTIDQLVERARSGESALSIIASMRASHALYPITGSDLARLRERGLPDPVLDEILHAQLDAVRYEEWRRARNAAWMYSPHFVPYGSFWGFGRVPYW